MAITSSVLTSRRKTFTISLIAAAAGDSITIPLTSTLISDQASSSSIALAVNISAFYANTGSGSVTVSRSGNTIIFATGTATYPSSVEKLPAFAQNNTTGISVSFTAPGQVVLELHKVAGTVDPNYNVGDYK
jgi:hypothetical protein